MRKHDYQSLEAEFIRTRMANGRPISIRELARRHNIESYSTVAQFARNHNWYEKQRNYQDIVDEKAREKAAERASAEEADLIVEVRSEMLTVIRAALYKFAGQLRDEEHPYIVNTLDLIKLMNQAMLLMGEPTARTEEKRLELSGTIGELPPDFLRRLAEATRPRAIDAGITSGAPRADHPATRRN